MLVRVLSTFGFYMYTLLFLLAGRTLCFVVSFSAFFSFPLLLYSVSIFLHRIRASYPPICLRSDGGFTYDTTDMAALRHRLHTEKADWAIYVTDAGQVCAVALLLWGAIGHTFWMGCRFHTRTHRTNR